MPRRDGGIGPAMVQEQLSAARLEGREIVGEDIDARLVGLRHFGVQVEIVPVIVLVLMAQNANDVPNAARRARDGAKRSDLQFGAGRISGPDDFALFGFYVAENDLYGFQL